MREFQQYISCSKMFDESREYTLVFRRHLPRSTLHEMLSAKYHQHVNATIVKHPCPIFDHPNACVLMYEFVFEIENIRIVWRQFHRVLCGLFAFGLY